MRFLIVTAPNGWGGTEVNSSLMIDALGSRGHEIELWQLPSAGSGHYSRRWSNRFGALLELSHQEATARQASSWWQERLGKSTPDVVVLAKGDTYTMFPGLDLAARRLGLPVVVIEHEPVLFPEQLEQVGPLTFLREWLNPGYRKLQLQQRLATWRISVSAITDRALNAYLKWTKRHRSVIHPGISFTEFRADPEGRNAVRAKYAIPEPALVFGAIGRYHPKKRFDLALRLFAQAQLPSDCYFLLAGGGEERNALSELASSLGIGARVRVADWVDGNERRAHLSALDCFVMVSTLEGLGMTLVEALACGCACIATDCGGPREVLTNPSLGLLVEQGDWGAIIREMQRLAAPGTRGEIAVGAKLRRAAIQREYEVTVQNAKYAELLEDIGRRASRQ